MSIVSYRKTGLAIVLAGLLSVSAAVRTTAQDTPVDMSADTIEYDSAQGLMIAQGGVKMVRDHAVLTGSSAQYNMKTKEVLITGGVIVVKDNARLTAAEVHSYDDNHIVAIGNVVVTKGADQLTGPRVEYFSDKDYAFVPANGKLLTVDGWMTADTIESFFKENRMVGDGHVHIVSDTRKVDAVSDHAVYYGSQGANGGKAVLTGNARAIQNGNILRGNVLTIYMADKPADAQKPAPLVIEPQEQSPPQE